MTRPALEVADIFRGHGPARREANADHISLDQMKVMSAVERCRAVALGAMWPVARAARTPSSRTISAATGHCPKCQGAAAREWLAERQAVMLVRRLVSGGRAASTLTARLGKASSRLGDRKPPCCMMGTSVTIMLIVEGVTRIFSSVRHPNNGKGRETRWPTL
jgi:hypothetical protein